MDLTKHTVAVHTPPSSLIALNGVKWFSVRTNVSVVKCFAMESVIAITVEMKTNRSLSSLLFYIGLKGSKKAHTAMHASSREYSDITYEMR